MYDDDIKI